LCIHVLANQTGRITCLGGHTEALTVSSDQRAKQRDLGKATSLLQAFGKEESQRNGNPAGSKMFMPTEFMGG